jgi:regulator of sigma E protease
MISYTLAKAVLAFLLTLLPLVFIHELGHYLVARWFGVHVESFSIGFGPRLVSWKDRNHTLWQIAAFPLGGYVKIAQDCTFDSIEIHHKTVKATEGPFAGQGNPHTMVKQGMASKTPFQRILIAMGGPAANYITAFCILMPALTLIGAPKTPAILAQPAEKTVAAAYLQKDDEIKAIDNKPVSSLEEVRLVLAQTRITKSADPLVLSLQRQGNPVTATIAPQDLPNIKPEADMSWGQALTGLRPSEQAVKERTHHPMPIGYALKITGKMMDPIAPLVQLKLKNLGGPVMIAQQASSALDEGWQTVLFFIAQISIALGFFNLLPLPGLDGGMVAMTTLEAIRGRALSERTQSILSITALATLAGLFVVLTWQDLMRIPLVAKALAWMA